MSIASRLQKAAPKDLPVHRLTVRKLLLVIACGLFAWAGFDVANAHYGIYAGWLVSTIGLGLMINVLLYALFPKVDWLVHTARPSQWVQVLTGKQT